MKKILLLNQDKVPHYRVPIYNYLSEFFMANQMDLKVVSSAIQENNPHDVRFDLYCIPLSTFSLLRYILNNKPDAIIFWVNLKYTYLFPVLLTSKLLGIRCIYWGHGRDLLDKDSTIKNCLYWLEHLIVDAIILYAIHLKKYVSSKFHHKTFIANNTLYLSDLTIDNISKEKVLSKYNILTPKNIICIGRMQKRKRIDHLVQAFELLNDPQVGLILVGPDTDGILDSFDSSNIYKLKPIYGDERLELLSSADVFCLPGAVGLSIVDAFYCGLPVVTETGDESPEIMYLKDGLNGYEVPKGDIFQLSSKLKLLIENSDLRNSFSKAAKKEISSHGHIDNLCKGFIESVHYVINTS